LLLKVHAVEFIFKLVAWRVIAVKEKSVLL
jgi:hypothetical protein